MTNCNCSTTSKQELMNIIVSASFALDDVQLFLDTHPYDTEALKYYQDYRKIRMVAIEEYTNNYGPLNADNVACDSSWSWIDSPWPWEGGCN